MEFVRNDNKKTVPRAGLVQEVRKEWIVHEDEALALRLQNQEIEAHYGGNRQRNRVVREDHPRARLEQEREIEEALAIRSLQEQIAKEQENADAAVARRLAEELEREEEEQRRMTQIRDERVAKRMQGLFIGTPGSSTPHPQDSHNHRRSLSGGSSSSAAVPQSSSEPGYSSKQPRPLPPSFSSFVNAADSSRHLPASPPHSRSSEHGFRTAVPQSRPSRRQQDSFDFGDVGFPADEELEEVEARHYQEEQDAELARLLHEVEQRKTFQRKATSNSSAEEQVDRDRMLAIEVQDRELARILQEKEKARLKRAKERARLKSSRRDEGERERSAQNSAPGGAGARGASSPVQNEIRRSLELHTNDQGIHKSQRQDLHSIELASPGTSSEGNIAMAIDPTYRSSTSCREREFPRSHPSSSSTTTPLDRRVDDEESEAPPYMPIAGQRRSLSLEKKKKSRDGCKQQ